MGGRERLAGQADELEWGKEGRERISFLGMQEGEPGIFQTLQIPYAIEKDEENSSFSPQPLLRAPGREANREGQLGEIIWGQRDQMDTN